MSRPFNGQMYVSFLDHPIFVSYKEFDLSPGKLVLYDKKDEYKALGSYDHNTKTIIISKDRFYRGY